MSNNSLFDIIKDIGFLSDFESNFIGAYGEWLTQIELGFVDFFGRNGKSLRNVYIPKDNGTTTEIDVVYITQKGIFVFESKNYSGWIFGSERDVYWTARLANGTKNYFYNPIMQNRSHLKWLSSYIREDIPLFSIIVFSERCELKKIAVYSQNIKVIKRNYLYSTVQIMWDELPDVMSENTVEKLYLHLKELTHVSNSTKKEHVSNINRNIKRSNDVNLSMMTNHVCPKCGEKLVLRTDKRGFYPGFP